MSFLLSSPPLYISSPPKLKDSYKMAVEARHLNIFPSSQLLGNREMMNQIHMYDTYGGVTGVVPLLSGTTTATETMQQQQLPTMYGGGGSVITDSIPQKFIKSDSSLTYNNSNFQALPSRKRSRENSSINNNNIITPFSFLGQDISLQIQEQQFDVDRLISQHMEKVRMEIEERRKRQARKIMDAIEESMMKKLRAKEEEIEKIAKLNWALEERVKTLCIENQLWRDLAHNNEATANALRSNLEQVLAAAQVKDMRTSGAGLDEEVIDDAQSCCGSSWEEEQEQQVDDEQNRQKQPRMLVNDDHHDNININKVSDNCQEGTSRLCRNCRKEESCVLLLPCRHLCLCTLCGSSLHTCPVCKSAKTISVHVNMS